MSGKCEAVRGGPDLGSAYAAEGTKAHELGHWSGHPSRLARTFGKRFGELEVNVANLFHAPGHPEVMILSNMVEDGKPLGLSDAGQDWHTDMSYSRMIAFTNVLYGMVIPHRDGKSLGNTEFCNMHAAYDALPLNIKMRLEGMTATHDFNKFWEMMRRERGSTRSACTASLALARPADGRFCVAGAVAVAPRTGAAGAATAAGRHGRLRA